MKRSPVMVFGGYHLQRLIEFCDIEWGSTIFLTELAFAVDKNFFYWIAKTDNNSFLSIMCEKDWTHVGWSHIRKDKDGQVQISQRIPKEIERSLRQKVVDSLRKEALSRLSWRTQETQ